MRSRCAHPNILLVSCAGKLHNARSVCMDLRTVGVTVFERFKAGQVGTIWYYAVLADSTAPTAI